MSANKEEKDNENDDLFTIDKKNIVRRASVAMQNMNFLFNHRKDNKGNNIMDNSIKEKVINRRRYSQSLIMPYIPLTRKQKVKEIVNMDKTSQNRFNEYSYIFDHIKNQISDINNSLLNGNLLNNSCHSNKMNISRTKTKPENSMFKPKKLNDKNENKDKDKDKDKKKYKNKKNNSKNHHTKHNNHINNINNYNINNNIIIGLSDDDYIDNKTLDENINNIYLNYSTAPNSLRNTKTKNRQFIKKHLYNSSDSFSKTERKFLRNKNNFNEFYYEPTLNDNDDNRYSSGIQEIKYCKCSIF